MNTTPPTHRWVESQARTARTHAHPSQVPTQTHQVDGWHIPYGPRPIVVTLTDPETSAVLSKESWHHGTVLRLISDLLDHLALHEPTNHRGAATALAVYEAIESDLDTGTSIASWPSWNALVDQVLNDATSIEDRYATITTAWSEF
ncbi:hypothetical protein Xcel_3390 (plasmid) [Xylanimonas cellulosilytica DSM 15894]|uniref:Uncharacterized protein n=1 Tax=Xylanimonas cellulosilytica (strain DSM 15894 / JCM 12276 / CECT 5975 / KCTC 9989 / LMG 20990 / NBRC 107835 / XIL07) TaxID=446471 RepID=D1C0S3_XYLCX|nr:hypothetical protein [Xylanimonas cellulosilytica]ACZ32389.1 hypothetical protein Xcel_3390 [Xylanimonas cellulosilytica DSM 15894]